MKKTIASSLLLAFVTTMATSQEKKELDRQAILDMCGCYEVSFKYTETFAPEIDYEKHLDYTSKALELALPIVDEDNKISLQHLLVLNDTTVIKHWRQDWLYENQAVFHYDKDNNWVFTQLPANAVKGQWTQKVYQVDDSPRYSGSSTWVHFDGRHYWENRSDSPLPRREYTKRSDYNVMSRGNRQEITANGWVHEQDNNKIIRTDGEQDVLLAQEKGYNTYVKVADERCQAAKEWWAENQDFWATARAAWDEVYNREGDLTLLKKVDDKPLFVHFYALEQKGATKAEVLETINKFVANTSVKNNVEGQ
ncbi:MAG: DUF6607 family protein [Allomuricauda sp.]|jgi:hypothetical protein|uniref:DUF6607 family protein n=1 Tax=Flagellimonas sp. TaxID=2058762 RepID=UPI001B071A30|nr:DUF6607 family protein [Allomuricauda sp.]MBO6532696.1 hypothetical protein [Allomuricauda sp.]MBO6587499.1 hypothetical protein [Allomuricauda sp.]MBO6617124.1 hypothetical protein [Allomuricauda sp.]MBO6643865.1 hypothetical protein [Allomuricauda sp.]MBO6745459.1 hypothetical protein [Allomuricauda sp.]